MESSKTYVWSFLGRLSHWLLVISFFACYYTSFYEQYLTLHVSIGIFVLGMFLKKIVWGLIGPKYAKWSDYNFSFKELKFYFLEKIENRYRKIKPGHNPASSWFAFLVTWIGILSCIIGLILYGIQEGKGVFSFLNNHYYMYMEYFQNIHIVLSLLLLVMIFFHISGVLVEQFYHKTNMIMAMISGYKQAKGKNIKPRFKMVFWGSFYTGLIFLIALYSYFIPNNVFIESKFKNIDYKLIHEDFFYECSDCHNLFPPSLLPEQSWIKLMNEQNKHFKENLDLDDNLIKSIEKFLIANSSDKSTKEAAFKITKELGKSDSYIITKTNYWKDIHKNISNKTFKSEAIESKSNCKACHKNFEKSNLFDINITYPSK